MGSAVGVLLAAATGGLRVVRVAEGFSISWLGARGQCDALCDSAAYALQGEEGEGGEERTG